MKIALILLALLAASSVFAGDVYVQPHTRSDGTYVQGYYRTAPDHSLQNNYSTQGNVNPYTGQSGTVDPYKQPQPTYQAPAYQQPQPIYQQPAQRSTSGCQYTYPRSC